MKIYIQIPKAIEAIGSIGKNGKNDIQKYKFRSIDDMYNKIQPVLPTLGLFFVPQVVESKEDIYENAKGNRAIRVKLRVKYTIFADDGSFVEAIVEGESIDTSDKATNKALTAAFKYMLIQLFCISIEGMDDADKDSPDIQSVNQKKNEADLAEINKVAGLMKAFTSIGVSTGQVLDYVGVPSTDKLSEGDIMSLKKIGTEIKTGKAKKEDYFKNGATK